MYTNLAYLGEEHEDIVDKSKPLIVTAAGYYRVHTSRVIDTERPNGRGDYQLLYIASGCGHFSLTVLSELFHKEIWSFFVPVKHRCIIYTPQINLKPIGYISLDRMLVCC